MLHFDRDSYKNSLQFVRFTLANSHGYRPERKTMSDEIPQVALKLCEENELKRFGIDKIQCPMCYKVAGIIFPSSAFS